VIGDDLEVEGDDSEDDFAVHGVPGVSPEPVVEEAFEQGKAGLDLPASTVDVGRPVLEQRSTVEAGGNVMGTFRRPATSRGNDADDLEGLVEKDVVVFPVIAHIAQEGLEGMPGVGLAGHPVKFDVVRFGASIDQHAEDQMAGNVHHGRYFGESAASTAGAAGVVDGSPAGGHTGVESMAAMALSSPSSPWSRASSMLASRSR